MSVQGLGCVKSRRREKLLEQISLRIASRAMTISERRQSERSDMRKPFSSFLSLGSFYTDRVINGRVIRQNERDPLLG
jgi:hypothetical protein